MIRGNTYILFSTSISHTLVYKSNRNLLVDLEELNDFDSSPTIPMYPLNDMECDTVSVDDIDIPRRCYILKINNE